MQYMQCNTRRYWDEEQTHPPHLGNGKRAIEQCSPHHCYRDDLYPQRNSLVLLEIPDMRTKMPVRHEPVVQSPWTAQIQRSRKQQEGRGGQHRQEYADYSKRKRQAPQKGKEIFHTVIRWVFRPRRYSKYCLKRDKMGREKQKRSEKTLFYHFFRIFRNHNL